MIAETHSYEWKRVLATPSQAIAFDAQYKAVRLVQPAEDGVIAWALAGTMKSPSMLKLMPMAFAQSGAIFTMRVTLFNVLGTNNQRQKVWLASVGYDFTCTVGDLPGIGTAGGGGVEMDGDERLCSTMVLAKGNLGIGSDAGRVNSYGAGALAGAWCEVPVSGSRLVKVEFASADPSGTVGMNALWAQR